MPLIGVIADSHDNLGALARSVEYLNGQGVGLVLHAGDFVAPFVFKELGRLACGLVGVWGNNDGDRILMKEQATQYGFFLHPAPYHLQWEGKDILLMHEPYELDAFIQSQCYDLIVYGHLHKTHVQRVGRTLVLNPGECGGWLGKSCTLAIMDPEKGSAKIHQV